MMLWSGFYKNIQLSWHFLTEDLVTEMGPIFPKIELNLNFNVGSIQFVLWGQLAKQAEF